MAGPSEISGVVPGVVPGPRGGDFSGAADSMAKMMQFMVQMNETKKQHAGQDLERMMNMVQGGFPVDPSAIMKAAKKAGMPIMKPDDMKAAVSPPQATQTGGQQPPQGGQQPPQGQQPPAGQQDPNAKGVQDISKGKNNLKEFKNSALQHWYDGAMKMAQQKGMRDQALMEYSMKVADMKNRAASGSNVDMGRLMSLNEIPFTLDKAMWTNMTDKQKSGLMDVAAGRETEKEFNARKDRMAESLITSGKISDPEMAQRAGDALAHGNPLPSDVKAAMKPNTMAELTQQAVFATQLVELGVPVDKIGTVSEAAAVGGLQNALPTGMKPLALQTVQLRQQELDVENKRLEVEGYRAETERGKAIADERHYQAMAAKFDAEAKSAEAKAALENFTALVQLKKAGGKVDDVILNQAAATMGQHFGVEAKEVDNFFHFLTGGTHLEFTPKPASDLANQAAGVKPKNKQQDPSYMNKFRQIMRQLGKGQGDEL